MAILSFLILAIAMLWVAWHMFFIRRALRHGEPVMPPAFAATSLFALSIGLVVCLDVSFLHLVWLFPLSFFLGLVVLFFPLGVRVIMACMGLLAGLKHDQES